MSLNKRISGIFTILAAGLFLLCSSAVAGFITPDPGLSQQTPYIPPPQEPDAIKPPPRTPAPPAGARKAPRPEKPAEPRSNILPILGVPEPAPQPASAPKTIQQDAYHIGSGDILTVSVWQNQDLSRKLVVLPDGKIHFPLIGEIAAKGKTPEALSRLIRDRLGNYVLEPELTVTVDQARSMVVYVTGKVSRSGSFAIKGPVDVLQALALAGGVTPYAKADEILIFRETGGRHTLFPFDYGQVTEGEHMAQNILLEPGDVIVVP